MELVDEIRACRLCASRFAAAATHHAPRPVVWFSPRASVLVAGQAPGLQVHLKGKPFADRSGDRLRDWMGIGPEVFYDQSRIAIVPMAFCFPGYDAKGADLPPPRLCAETWRARVMAELAPKMVLLVGGHAQSWHLGTRNVTETVAAWRSYAPAYWPLPHPSWRNTGWLRRNPWFEDELLPAMRAELAQRMRDER